MSKNMREKLRMLKESIGRGRTEEIFCSRNYLGAGEKLERCDAVGEKSEQLVFEVFSNSSLVAHVTKAPVFDDLAKKIDYYVGIKKEHGGYGNIKMQVKTDPSAIGECKDKMVKQLGLFFGSVDDALVKHNIIVIHTGGQYSDDEIRKNIINDQLVAWVKKKQETTRGYVFSNILA